MYKKTIKSLNPEHPKMTILILDTEGLGGLDASSNYDSKILLLALLLSSYFMYNSVGLIDEMAINNLSLLVNLAKEIQINKS